MRIFEIFTVSGIFLIVHVNWTKRVFIFLKLVDTQFFLILSSKWIVCDRIEPSTDTGTGILGWAFLNYLDNRLKSNSRSPELILD